MKASILKCLAYFDVFDHPLTTDELAYLCNQGEMKNGFTSDIEQLRKDGLCFKEHNYLSLNKNIRRLVTERKKREQEAQHYFRKLPFYTRIIRSFPFVRAVGVSGSLSKNIMSDDGDIDYFIVTAPNRLWISRTMLVLFKKLFLLNSKKYFCINYFVDENHLKIPEENIFTAIEVIYLLPVFNHALIDKMKAQNHWTEHFFPDFKHPLSVDEISDGGIFKKFLEFLLKGKFGNKLDLLFMKLTLKRWKRKFGSFNDDKFELTMRTNRGISKHHPQNFQKTVLETYARKLKHLNIQE